MSAGLNFQCLSVVQPCPQSVALLVLGDVQEALDDGGAVFGQVRLEVVDRLVPVVDRRGGGELADPRDEHVLVVRAVEEPDHARPWSLLPDSPEEPPLALCRGRRLERRDVQTLGIQHCRAVADGAALAGGVHPLQDNKDPVHTAGASLREQPLLVLRQLLGRVLRERLLALGLPAIEPGVLSQSTSASRNPSPTRSSSSILTAGVTFAFVFAMTAILPGPEDPATPYSPHAPPPGGPGRLRGLRPRRDARRLSARGALRGPPPRRVWVRANFATSLDGAITGPDGRSGSVNSAADHVVFELLRGLSDVVVVGPGRCGPRATPPCRWRAAGRQRDPRSASLPCFPWYACLTRARCPRGCVTHPAERS